MRSNGKLKFLMAISLTSAFLGIPFPAAAKTLLVGDSHSVGDSIKGGFGTELHRLLVEKVDLDTDTYASCGSSPMWWFTGHPTPCGYLEIHGKAPKAFATRHPTPILKTLLTDKVRLLIIEQGTNILPMGDAEAANNVNKTMELIGPATNKRKCVWIGPPDNGSRELRPRARPVANLIRGLVEPRCKFVDSLNYTSYNENYKDPMRLHFPPDAGKAWARDVFDQEILPYLGSD